VLEIPPLCFGGFDVNILDLIAAMAFIYYMSQLLLARGHVNETQERINKRYLAFLVVGLIPVLAEVIRGKSDILYPYRFFFYFILVPMLVKLVQEHPRPIRIIHYMITINSASIIVALVKSVALEGFQLQYLNIPAEINMFVLLIMLAFCLKRKPLLGNNITTVVIFLFCLLCLLIDHSRKMYVGFAIGSFLLYLAFKDLPTKRNFLFSSLITTSLLLGFFYYFGVLEAFVERSKTIFVLPIEDNVSEVDLSVGHRLHAWTICRKVISEYPLLGIGTGEKSNDILDKIGGDPYGFHAHSPHNFYLQGLVLYGIPLMVLIYCVIIDFLRLSWKNIRRLPKNVNGTLIAIGAFCGFISFSTAMFFEGFEIRTMFLIWLFFGLTIGFANPVQKVLEYRSGCLAFPPKARRLIKKPPFVLQ
jgi:O-antigen ligase